MNENDGNWIRLIKCSKDEVRQKIHIGAFYCCSYSRDDSLSMHIGADGLHHDCEAGFLEQAVGGLCV